MARKKKPGRPRLMRSSDLVSVRLPSSLLRRLDAFARRRSAGSRSEAIRYLLGHALDEMAKEDRARPSRSSRSR